MGLVKWNSEKDNELRGHLREGLTNGQIARAMGVSYSSITSRLSKLGLTSFRGKRQQSPQLKAARRTVMLTMVKNRERRRLAAKFPECDLSKIPIPSHVEIIKLPIGAHLTWVPSWMGNTIRHVRGARFG